MMKDGWGFESSVDVFHRTSNQWWTVRECARAEKMTEKKESWVGEGNESPGAVSRVNMQRERDSGPTYLLAKKILTALSLSCFPETVACSAPVVSSSGSSNGS